MRTMRLLTTMLSAIALPALLALAAVPSLARQSQAQPSVQTPQQTQHAQQAREQAEAYLRKEESATTVRQSQSTERADQDATVADEAAGHSDAARPARGTNPNAAPSTTRPSGSAPPSYGPVLNPRQPQAADPARKDPAEVHDETDSLSRQPTQAPQPPQPPQKQKQAKQAQSRRQAWQPEVPMAPRSLNTPESAVIGTGMVPVPPPAAAPQPVVPSSQPLNSCVGGACRDAAGGSYNLGPTGTGVSSSGRLCSRSGATVQCF
jgi:FtsZ-interacting cell division protein ZipA